MSVMPTVWPTLAAGLSSGVRITGCASAEAAIKKRIVTIADFFIGIEYVYSRSTIRFSTAEVRMKLLSRLWQFAVVFLCAATLVGQTTTGSLMGTVTSQGNPVPGVMVTVSSPDLQGTRSA